VTPLDQALFDAPATALPSNSTLRRLELQWQERNDNAHVPPVFMALGKNTGMKTLNVDVHDLMNESLCTALRDGLGMNTTLESLELNHVYLTDDNSDLWCEAFSFFRINIALKSLVVTQSSASAFRTYIVAMLEDNASLESISILGCWIGFTAEKYIALITALQHNTKLKSIVLKDCSTFLLLTVDEDKEMAVVLQKNYALESLPDINQGGDVGAILRLNRAGRRYLVQDGSSISKGVEVLMSVRNKVNCVFLHLLENPRLCDRSAVEETASDSTNTSGSRGSTSPANHNGKREQEQDQALKEDKESRRRRTWR
jgi:hypothetical protein